MTRPLASDIHLRAATSTDASAVHALLSAAKLPLAGLPDDLAHFFVAERAARIVGAIGLERFGDAALLRSAVVHPDLRGMGVGEALTRALISHAEANRVRELVLLTETAADWFPRFGFTRITRADAPAAVQASLEFTAACPASAIVMSRRLASTAAATEQHP